MVNVSHWVMLKQYSIGKQPVDCYVERGEFMTGRMSVKFHYTIDTTGFQINFFLIITDWWKKRNLNQALTLKNNNSFSLVRQIGSTWKLYGQRQDYVEYAIVYSFCTQCATPQTFKPFVLIELHHRLVNQLKKILCLEQTIIHFAREKKRRSAMEK